MIKLSRRGVKAPADWDHTLAKALPDVKAYRAHAKKFEKLGLNSPQRRGGFSKFAPQVLKRQRGKPTFPSIWGVAKEPLAIMSYFKCAYCEHGIPATRMGQVEHFKPKALFPTLAYDWKNYFLACGGCNGAKSDKWPKTGGYLRPDEGQPSKDLTFSTDGKVKPVKAGGAAENTVRDFNLKREWLVRHRRRHIQDMIDRLNDCLKAWRADRTLGRWLARREFRRLKNPNNCYSAALIQCFRQEWKAALPGVPL